MTQGPMCYKELLLDTVDNKSKSVLCFLCNSSSLTTNPTLRLRAWHKHICQKVV